MSQEQLRKDFEKEFGKSKPNPDAFDMTIDVENWEAEQAELDNYNEEYTKWLESFILSGMPITIAADNLIITVENNRYVIRKQ